MEPYSKRNKESLFGFGRSRRVIQVDATSLKVPIAAGKVAGCHEICEAGNKIISGLSVYISKA